jgi:phytoene synthase
MLRRWRIELGKALQGTSEYSLLNQLSSTARRFNIPVGYFYDLIRGVEMDLEKKRYSTFEELKEYCYLVASTVGLMCREIFGYRTESTKDYAINLGIALQLTNIIRDIKDDARRGRIYLPAEDLARFRVSEDDIIEGRYTPEFFELMRYECDRASSYFDDAREALRDEDKHYFFAARVMWSIYAHILQKIKRSGYRVFDRRIGIPTTLKLLITLRYWLSHTLKYS